jgi:hypothetical protein
MWGLFRTRCGCERLLAIPNPPPMHYTLPLRISAGVGVYVPDYDERPLQSETRRFDRHGFVTEGHVLYLEVE